MRLPNFIPSTDAIIIYGVVGLFFVLAVAVAVGLPILLVTDFWGDDAWPSGLFLGLLVLHFLSVLWRYSAQEAAERRWLEDEEYEMFEYYS